MSGRPPQPLHVSIRRARARLALMGLIGWGVLTAASVAIHHHEGHAPAAAIAASAHAGRA
ncbi:hypothetical protein [Phenylobacterium sp.]|uniref:hypothetical protein n=1 Tax=Phenylobacterium sp. TaxID=1871053 RepID=UPI002BFC9E02|nr:hypothetical protein [Phenylobacterium sp.]HLZ74772.1 hypothetical protein [Phenylobacterium sp.]